MRLFEPRGEPGAGLAKTEQAPGLMGFRGPTAQGRRYTDKDRTIKPLTVSTREAPGAVTYASGGKRQPGRTAGAKSPSERKRDKGTATLLDNGLVVGVGGAFGILSRNPIRIKRSRAEAWTYQTPGVLL